MQKHHDPKYAAYIIDGLTNGFDMRRTGQQPTNIQRNLPTTNPEKLHITNWLIDGIQQGHFIGPFEKPPFATYFTSPVGTVPKDETKFRTIHHLSAPRNGISVNSGITDAAKAVTYITFKQIITWIAALGPNAWLWKSDLANAYRQLQLKNEAIPLLGIKWLNRYVFDCRGPFGLASMPAIFQSFGDALLFCVITLYPAAFYVPEYPLQSLHHLLDDFFGGHNSQQLANKQYTAFLNTAKALGVEVSIKKSFEPTQKLVILGYEYDTCQQTVAIPANKTAAILQLIGTILSIDRIQYRQIQSIAGKLRWLCSIFPMGAAFVRRIEALVDFSKPGHFKTRINAACRKDLLWWLNILKHRQQLHRPLAHFLSKPSDATTAIYTDASSVGLGAKIYPQQRVISTVNVITIPGTHDILWSEMFAVVLAVYVWRTHITTQQVILFCDNHAVVHMLTRRCAPQSRKDLQQLIRIFCFLADATPFHYWMQHIAGEQNTEADLLSRAPIPAQLAHLSDNTHIINYIHNLLQCNDNYFSLLN